MKHLKTFENINTTFTVGDIVYPDPDYFSGLLKPNRKYKISKIKDINGNRLTSSSNPNDIAIIFIGDDSSAGDYSFHLYKFLNEEQWKIKTTANKYNI